LRWEEEVEVTRLEEDLDEDERQDSEEEEDEDEEGEEGHEEGAGGARGWYGAVRRGGGVMGLL
jgi:hypothetical protein